MTSSQRIRCSTAGYDSDDSDSDDDDDDVAAAAGDCAIVDLPGVNKMLSKTDGFW